VGLEDLHDTSMDYRSVDGKLETDGARATYLKVRVYAWWVRKFVTSGPTAAQSSHIHLR
jgi:hypothetical protein